MYLFSLERRFLAVSGRPFLVGGLDVLVSVGVVELTSDSVVFGDVIGTCDDVTVVLDDVTEGCDDAPVLETSRSISVLYNGIV